MTTEDIKEAVSKAIRPMEGWCSDEKAWALVEIIIRKELKTVLEIGVFGGRSVVACAIAMKSVQYHGFVWGVDPWRNADCIVGDIGKANVDWWAKLDLHVIHQRCMEAIWANKLEDNVMIIRNTSEATWHAMKLLRPDLLHIDGNHSEEASMKDVRLWLPRLAKGGVLVFDDIDWPTTKNTVAYLDRNLKKLFDVGPCRFYEKS